MQKQGLRIFEDRKSGRFCDAAQDALAFAELRLSAMKVVASRWRGLNFQEVQANSQRSGGVLRLMHSLVSQQGLFVLLEQLPLRQLPRTIWLGELQQCSQTMPHR